MWILPLEPLGISILFPRMCLLCTQVCVQIYYWWFSTVEIESRCLLSRLEARLVKAKVVVNVLRVQVQVWDMAKRQWCFCLCDWYCYLKVIPKKMLVSLVNVYQLLVIFKKLDFYNCYSFHLFQPSSHWKYLKKNHSQSQISRIEEAETRRSYIQTSLDYVIRPCLCTQTPATASMPCPPKAYLLLHL